MKTFVESQLGYCPFLWIFHSRKRKINHLQERFLELCVMITKARFKIDMFICIYIYIRKYKSE